MPPPSRPPPTCRDFAGEIIAVLGSKICHESLALAEVGGDALIVVIGDIVRHDHGCLRVRQQTPFHCRHSLPVRRVEVHNRASVFARHVDRRVNGETRRVHRVLRAAERVPDACSILTRLEAVISSNIMS